MSTENSNSSNDEFPLSFGALVLLIGLIGGMLHIFIEAIKFWAAILSSVHSFEQFVSFACGFVLAMLCGVSVDLALEILRKRHQSS